MNCYICDQAPPAGGVHYHIPAAVGVCTQCGIGVCAEHSQKQEEPGAPLFCLTCANLVIPTREPATEIETQLAG